MCVCVCFYCNRIGLFLIFAIHWGQSQTSATFLVMMDANKRKLRKMTKYSLFRTLNLHNNKTRYHTLIKSSLYKVYISNFITFSNLTGPLHRQSFACACHSLTNTMTGSKVDNLQAAQAKLIRVEGP